MNLVTVKNFRPPENAAKEMKRPATERGEEFVKRVSDKELVSKICKRI